MLDEASSTNQIVVSLLKLTGDVNSVCWSFVSTSAASKSRLKVTAASSVCVLKCTWNILYMLDLMTCIDALDFLLTTYQTTH